MLSEYLMGCKNEPVKKYADLLNYNAVLQKGENRKFHPIEYCTGIIIVVANNYNVHRYLDSECVPFIIFAFLVVFSSI